MGNERQDESDSAGLSSASESFLPEFGQTVQLVVEDQLSRFLPQSSPGTLENTTLQSLQSEAGNLLTQYSPTAMLSQGRTTLSELPLLSLGNQESWLLQEHQPQSDQAKVTQEQSSPSELGNHLLSTLEHYSMQAVVNQLTEAVGTPPPIRLTEDGAFPKLTFQSSLKEQKIGLTAESSFGRISLAVQEQSATMRTMFSLPYESQLSYEVTAGGTGGQASLRLWSNNTGHSPYLEFKSNLRNGIGFSFLRNDQGERAGINAAFGPLSLSATDDLRKNELSFSAMRQWQPGLTGGLNFEISPHGYTAGMQIVITRPSSQPAHQPER